MSIQQAATSAIGSTVNDKCLICSHVAFSDSEQNAIFEMISNFLFDFFLIFGRKFSGIIFNRDFETKKALSTDIGEYCTVISWQDLSGDKYAADNTGKLVWSTTTDNYCVAQFFIYHALDINK